MAIGTVRQWYDDEGWGVLDSEATPGGCFAHYSMIAQEGYRRPLGRRSGAFRVGAG